MPYSPSRRGSQSSLCLTVLAFGSLGLSMAVAADGTKPPTAPAESFSKEQKAHWAFQPLKRAETCRVKDSAWVRNPIDVFILSGLESVDFRHGPEADRISLIRRVTFDLTGLPPSPDEVAAFRNDETPDAYERLVDRLLASPRYGERWAQHWLDLAHYADTNGFELDAERPDAWRYRDWVVRSLNEDMPYDRFVTLQLAGDEAEPGDTSALIATGFGRSGPREVVGGNVEPTVKRQSELTEVTGTVGSVFLGLTLGCARCHDHKFDPLPTTDYYRLQAFFSGAELVDLPTASKSEIDAYEARKMAVDAQVAPRRQRMAKIEAPYRQAILDGKTARLTTTERAVIAIPKKDRTPSQKRLVEGLAITLKVSWEEAAEAVAKNPVDHAERERLKRAIDSLEKTLPRPPAEVHALVDRKPSAPETYVYRRGDPKNLGPRVSPRPPGIVLGSQAEGAFREESVVPTKETTGRRLALARWLTRPDNPLTARVAVNRLWQHHFGRGIVATPSDFGVRGEPPSHPELLDWLASELIAQGWQLKPLHRLMVTSATYRQASAHLDVATGKTQAADDPENTLLWRMNRRRLEAESLRDAMLAATGELNPKAGGPGVLVPIEKEVEDLIFTEAEVVDIWPETPEVADHNRRSLYLYRKRNVRYPMFDAFDAPDTQTACPQRAVSTHALQALVLLNSDFAADRAKALAGVVLREARGDDKRAIQELYRRVLARAPKPDETERAREFLRTQAEFLTRRAGDGQPLARPAFCPDGMDLPLAAAWVDFSLAMLNRNEFLYVP